VRTLSPSTSGDLQSAVRAVSELNALKEQCAMWRKRAEMHAAANTALLGFVRGAKDCALRLGAERDAERSRCVLLKRKLAELMEESVFTQGTGTKRSRSRLGHESEEVERVGRGQEEMNQRMERVVLPVPAPVGLPVFLMQCKAYGKFVDNPADKEESCLGPPLKRRRTGSPSGVGKQ
jgi:hypothetical protein